MIYLDTSALIRAWRLKQAPRQLTRSHSVAEFYATLTRGLTVTVRGVKTRVQFAPKVAAAGASETFSGMVFRDLTGQQSLKQLELAARENVQSANIHDWMHAAVAEMENCREIVTTNEKHFKQVTKLKITDPASFFAKS